MLGTTTCQSTATYNDQKTLSISKYGLWCGTGSSIVSLGSNNDIDIATNVPVRCGAPLEKNFLFLSHKAAKSKSIRDALLSGSSPGGPIMMLPQEMSRCIPGK